MNNSAYIRRITLCAIGLFALTNTTFAQGNERIITGVIVDKQTKMPLSSAVMHTAECSYAADEQGRIAARVKVGDVVAFTHVGYQTARMQIVDTLAYQSIFSIMMTEDTLMLSEVVVRPRVVNLERLARTMPLQIKQEDVIVRTNFENATLIALYTQPQAIDAQMAQSRQMDAFVSEQVNRGMIASNQMISISSLRIFALISELQRKSKRSTPAKPTNHITPISAQEIESLMNRP